MSQENVEIVRAIYAAWLEGESARDFIDPDVEYVNPPDAVEPGTRRGRRAFAGIRDAYVHVRIEPEEFIDAGDDVVVALTRGRSVSLENTGGLRAAPASPRCSRPAADTRR